MSHNFTEETEQKSKLTLWYEDWISDWLGLFDTIVGIITLTACYPQTQTWWFKKRNR